MKKNRSFTFLALFLFLAFFCILSSLGFIAASFFIEMLKDYIVIGVAVFIAGCSFALIASFVNIFG